MTSAFVPTAAARPAATAGPSPLRRAAHWLIPDRRDGMVALALVLGVWLSNLFGILALLDGWQPVRAAAFALDNLASSLAHFVSVAAVARWAVSWKLAGWRHTLLLALAMAAMLFVHAGVRISAGSWWPDLPGSFSSTTVGLGLGNPAVSWSVAALWFPLGLLLAAQFQRSAQERSARARLDTVLREQRLAQRGFAEARLQQIQSRIDPEMLFEMLEHVRRLYGTNAVRAERLLDELIDFLRAVLPRLHSATSTLSRELRIAASYQRLRGLADQFAVDLEATLPAELAEAPFPPGVMLPLVEALLRQPGAAGGRIHVAAERADRGCRIVLSAAAGAPDDAALGRVRATLGDLFGTRCRLDTARLAGRTTVTLSLPDEDRRD